MADYIVDFDNKFIERLKEADKALEGLVDATNKMTASFQKMASGGLAQFANAIDTIVNKVSVLSTTKVGDMGLTETSNAAAKVVDNVEEAFEMVNKLKASNSDIPTIKSGEQYVLVDTSKLEKEIEQLDRAIKTVDRKKKDYKTKYEKLVAAESAPSKIRDAKVQFETEGNELTRLKRELGKLQKKLLEAQNKNKEAIAQQLNSTSNEFMPIGALKANINEINKLIHEVPSLYPDPKEQQKVVNQLVSLRERYAESMKSSEQKAREYAKQIRTEYRDILKDQTNLEKSIKLAGDSQSKYGGTASKETVGLLLSEHAAVVKRRQELEQNYYAVIADLAKKDAKARAATEVAEDKKTRQQKQKDAENDEKARYQLALAALSARQKAEVEAERQISNARREIAMADTEEIQRKAQTKEDAKIASDAAKQASQEYASSFKDRVKAWEKGFDESVDIERKQYQLEQESADKENKLNKARAQSEIDAYNKRIKARREYVKEQEKMYADLFNQQEMEYRRTPQGALEYSANAKSIREQTEAIKHLKIARDNLDSTSFSSEEEYKKKVKEINDEIDKRKESISELTGEYKKHSAVIAQIKPLLVSAFSARAIMQYAKQLVAIRGEFEIQQRSLQVLLKSKTEANKLWAQTTELALKSPFQVKQLVTATKQLAAYRVESEKLHDTTKMLADISAGLGVEMSRLILAFGQVKAANFLRGTELRQFSEAGINMLDELSAYYSKLEGEFVSVAEVFDRISKRAVSFSDVEAVLKNVVSEGGTFYKMQEQQADTLKGSISNLKDSYQLMLNDIGKGTDGFMKSVVKITKFLIDNWESFATILKAAIPLWAAHALGVSKLGRLLRLSNESMVGTARAIGLVKRGFNSAAKSVKAFFASMGPLGWFLLALEALYAILNKVTGGFGSNVREIETEMADLKNKFDDISVKFYVAVDKGSLEDQRLQLKRYLEALSNELSVDIKPTINIDDKDATAEQIQEQMAEAQRVADLVTTSLSHFSIAAEKELNRTWVTEALNEDAEDLKETAAESLHTLVEYRTKLITELKKVEKAAINGGRAMRNSERDMLNTLLAAEKGKDETSDEYLDRLRSIFNTLSIGKKETSGKIYVTLDDVKAQTKEFSKDLGEFEKELKRIINETNIPNLSEEDRKIVLEAVIKTYAAEREWGSFVTWAAQRWAEQTFYPNIGTTEISYDNDPLRGTWKERYNKALAENTDNGAIKLSDVTKATVESTEEAVRNTLEGAITYFQTVIDVFEKTGEAGRYSVDEYNEALDKLPRAESIRDIIWGKNDNDGSKDTRYSDLIRTVNDVYSAFDKLEEKFGDTIATEMLWRDYSEAVDTAFKKVGKSAAWVREQFGDLTDKQSLKSALDWIAQNASTKEARLQAQTASAKISVDLEIEARDKEFEKLTNKVEDMFSGYELAIELDKLHIPKEFAKDFFNIDAIDITELRKRLAELKPQFDAKGTEGEKEYREYLRKLDEMEVKSQQERLKKYQEFTRKAISERAKIMLDSFYEFQEIEKAFQMTNTMALNKGLIDENIKRDLDSAGKSILDLLELSDSEIMNDWFITEDQIALLREFNAELQRQRALAKEGANQKTKTDLDKEAWEQFQTTDTFQMLMSDLENMSEAAIGKMIEQLKQYKEQWKDMPVSDIKQLVDTIEKLKDAQAAFKTPRELKRVLEGYLSEGVNVQDEETGITTATYHFDSVADAQNKLVDSELRIQALEEELALVEQIEALRAPEVTDAEILNQLKSQGLHSEEAISNALGKSSKELKANIKEEKNRKTAASKVVGVTEDIQASYKEQADRIKKVQDLTNSLFDGWEAINSLFEDDSMSAALASMSGSIVDSVLNCLALQANLKASTVEANTFGAAMNKAMGVIGWIVMAIQAITAILKFAFEQHDKNLQKQIDAQQEKVEKLQKEYEELEKQIEKAYMAADLGRLTREAEENLQRQIDATEKMIALEEDKKKTDEDAIKDWKDDIDDMRESIEELHEETFSTLTDGVLDNVLDATRGFVDAWHDAFLETGDGAKGLEDSFKDMMQSIVRQQASMTILGPFIDQLKGKLNQYVNTYDTMLDPAEAADLKQWFENNKDSMNESLEAYFGAFDSLFDGSGELSDLEKGIQGMTEDQAEVLAAYWNSCRFMLSNIDTTLTRMAANVLDTSGENNPIVAALNAQTEVITAIKDMFSSVIETGNGVQHNGAYLKVFMP